MEAFTDWLGATGASMTIQNVTWIIPSVQSVHILAIAVLLAAVVTIDLRLAGVTRRGPSLAALEMRFLPWFWIALAVLLATGLILVVGEPARELLNWLFYTKLVLVLAVTALTALFQLRVRADDGAWETTAARRAAGRILGGASLLLVAATITAGRWIAYVVV